MTYFVLCGIFLAICIGCAALYNTNRPGYQAIVILLGLALFGVMVSGKAYNAYYGIIDPDEPPVD